MGKYDDAIYDYFADNERFADLFNAVFFSGKPVLKGGQLEPRPERDVAFDSQRDAPILSQRNVPAPDMESDPLPSGQPGLKPSGKSGAKSSGKKNSELPETESRFRDVRKRVSTGEIFVMTAIEAQTDIDYTMPWRIMNYDQMEYGRQIREIRRQKSDDLQKQGKPTHEWAIRLGPEDLLCPIYTICFYHGTEPWTGPRSLRDMMRFKGTDNEDIWRQYFHDYGMALFWVGEAGDLSRFRTDLRQLIEVLSARKDKKRLSDLWNREDFTRMDRDTAKIMAIMTESAEVLDKLDKYENEEGGVNMCEAMNDLKKDWKEEGRAEEKEKGIACLIETVKELGGNIEAAIQKVAAKYELDETTASAKVKLYW